MTFNNSREGLPRAVSLDSVKSDSPYHFYQTKVLEEYVRRPANASTLRQYIFFGRQMTPERLITAANWVRSELLTRLAHRIRDFQQLPFLVGTNPHIEYVYRLYWGAFEKIRQQPVIQDLEDNTHFCQVLRDLLEDGKLVVPRLARGVSECSAACYNHQDLDRFVNRMLRSRISRRTLAEQHIALTDANEHGWVNEDDGYIGIIYVRCSASKVVQRASSLVRNHAHQIYGRQPPEIHVHVHNDAHQHGMQQQQQDDNNEIIFAYVPEHLEYILFELISNAVRYTLERHTQGNIPAVEVTVSANAKDVFFRISDQAGGITSERYGQLWSYQSRHHLGNLERGILKMPMDMRERAEQATDLGHEHVGMGLPMSRVYAEYWGGELQVMTMDGYGTDAYVRIPRLGTNAENLGLEDNPAAIKNERRKAKQHQQQQHRQHNDAISSQYNYHPSIVQKNTNLTSYALESDGWSQSYMVRE
ncbi:hypothetical protein O0I10_009202 [Lichtheimia ornata]|uniref:Protein-serine/threonine kinase n=1 Tax=Lichtheimia ornata TaxID=688661 RepID=A0AAD7UXA4_9FUNG|nr:uncharacterized protein O0I10_009202 [Lichtheimia ornata]KAJ8655167.1 hypothetical protein O0I10_009202 [Lichtheimia ornata]